MSKKIVVNRSSSTLEYFEGDRRINKWDCVVGNNGATPLGTHSVLLKDQSKRSVKYNADMKYSLKFTSDYCAIHATGAALVRSWAQYFGVPDVGSHGCVGLSESNAAVLFSWADIGTPIVVQDT